LKNSGFGFRVSDWVCGLEFPDQGLGFISEIRFRVSGFGFGISGFGFQVPGSGVCMQASQVRAGCPAHLRVRLNRSRADAALICLL